MRLTIETLTLVAALGCTSMAGVFFAFSGFVMAGLARLPSAQGIAAMQWINVAAVRPPLMTALFGTAAACVALDARALTTWGDRRATLLLAGSVFYLIGVVALTITYHVPRNNALAAVDPDSAGAAGLWARYARRWTRANHVRAVAALAAGAAFAMALVPSSSPLLG